MIGLMVRQRKLVLVVAGSCGQSSKQGESESENKLKVMLILIVKG